VLCFVARRSLKILGAGRIRRGKQGDRNKNISLVYPSLVDFEYKRTFEQVCVRNICGNFKLSYQQLQIKYDSLSYIHTTFIYLFAASLWFVP
jgi:hypothetical protein